MLETQDCGSLWLRTRRAAEVAAMLVLCCGCFDWGSFQRGGTGTEQPAAVATESNSDAVVESIDSVAAGDGELALAADSESDGEDGPTPHQRRYLAVASPFLKAVAARDYSAAFEKLGPMAKARLSRNQFVPVDDDQQFAIIEAQAIEHPTAAQFVEMMTLAESFYGLPAQMDPPQVETNPEILSRQDPVMAAFEIGNMPDSIPVAHRKAAVQTHVYCRLTDGQLKTAAEAEGVDEAEYRVMLNEALAEGEGPYFKLKTVVIDDGGGPAIGYFELAPRSLLD